jgi:hypothetical protein
MGTAANIIQSTINAVSSFSGTFRGVATTYSFKDLSGAMTSPLAGVFVLAGAIGEGKVSVEYTTEHGAIETSADGTVLPVFAAGRSGRITIECLQTSIIHHWLIHWHNLHEQQCQAMDISLWASSALLLRNTLDGSSHEALGVFPSKIPDKAYAAQPTMITWTLFCSNLKSL